MAVPMSPITWEDFEKVDMRVGKVVDVQDFPEARKPSYRLWIDFGPLGVKKSSAAVKAWYSKEDLLGRQVVAVVNFPPKQIANFMSEVLVLGAVEGDGTVVLLRPDREAELGARIA
jgi:tRNA-binding protein